MRPARERLQQECWGTDTGAAGAPCESAQIVPLRLAALGQVFSGSFVSRYYDVVVVVVVVV